MRPTPTVAPPLPPGRATPRSTPPRWRRALAPVLATVLGAAVLAGCASDADKGEFGSFQPGRDGGSGKTLTLVEQPWVDLQVENEIARQLLSEAGYRVRTNAVAVEVGAQALTAGNADAYLGNWWPSQEGTFGKAIDDGALEVTSTMVEGTQYSPAVPKQFADELGITSMADLDANGDAFDRKIYGIEAGSPGNATIQQAIDDDAYGLGDWTLVESGTPAMLTQVEKNTKDDKATVFLAWSPHWMTVQFDTVFLEDPDGVWGGGGEIRTLVNADYAEDNPEVVRFLENLTFTTDEAGQFYFEHDKEGKSLAEIASAWIEANPDKVEQFLAGVTGDDSADDSADDTDDDTDDEAGQS